MVSAPRLKLKLVLGDDDTLLGPGKIALLKAIQREQSLSKAAKSINMSYRRAWLLIQELNDALTVIRNLRPVSYYYNEESGLNTTRKHYGFIAQEYFKEMPDAVYTDDVRGYLKIDTQELIGVLVKAVQELDTELKDLKKSLEYSEYSS